MLFETTRALARAVPGLNRLLDRRKAAEQAQPITQPPALPPPPAFLETSIDSSVGPAFSEVMTDIPEPLAFDALVEPAPKASAIAQDDQSDLAASSNLLAEPRAFFRGNTYFEPTIDHVALWRLAQGPLESTELHVLVMEKAARGTSTVQKARALLHRNGYVDDISGVSSITTKGIVRLAECQRIWLGLSAPAAPTGEIFVAPRRAVDGLSAGLRTEGKKTFGSILGDSIVQGPVAPRIRNAVRTAAEYLCGKALRSNPLNFSNAVEPFILDAYRVGYLDGRNAAEATARPPADQPSISDQPEPSLAGKPASSRRRIAKPRARMPVEETTDYKLYLEHLGGLTARAIAIAHGHALSGVQSRLSRMRIRHRNGECPNLPPLVQVKPPPKDDPLDYPPAWLVQ